MTEVAEGLCQLFCVAVDGTLNWQAGGNSDRQVPLQASRYRCSTNDLFLKQKYKQFLVLACSKPCFLLFPFDFEMIIVILHNTLTD